ncbi:MAG: 2-isopropylmalate synthase [Euryarchaeota archaeon]|nr:2-isopropylmalate synthase [Euryarchaeota archaeon]
MSTKLPTKIRVLDTTLRDGEQTPGVSLTPEEKLRTARRLDELGIDIIEAGSAITSEGERQAIKLIANAGLNAEICSFSRPIQSDIDLALACDVDSIHLVVPTSDIHLQYKLKKTREQVNEMAIKAIEYAKAHGLIVELSAEDASRTNISHLKEFYKAGIEAKADRCCFCDTVGVMTPENTTQIFQELKKEIKVPVAAHCHDDFGLAVANTLASLRGGAEEFHATINGIGERAGNASLEEIVMSLISFYGTKLNIKTELLVETSKLVERLTGIPVPPNKAIVGEHAFAHEAGIHTHGVLAYPGTYEPITPEMVGHRRRFILGKDVGSHAIKVMLKEVGLEPTEDELKQVVNRVKELGDKGKKITDADLQSIAESVMGVIGEKFVELNELTVVTGNRVTPTASVRLKIRDQEFLQSATGVGPVDAALNAIQKVLGELADVNLDQYRVEAITGGTDALVEVHVKLRRNNQIVTARGSASDIVMASVEAMLAGINRLLTRYPKK